MNILLDTFSGKRPLGRPGVDDMTVLITDIKEIHINTRNWIVSAKDSNYWRTLENATLNLRVP